MGPFEILNMLISFKTRIVHEKNMRRTINVWWVDFEYSKYHRISQNVRPIRLWLNVGILFKTMPLWQEVMRHVTLAYTYTGMRSNLHACRQASF